jgi:hypothetical protein
MAEKKGLKDYGILALSSLAGVPAGLFDDKFKYKPPATAPAKAAAGDAPAIDTSGAPSSEGGIPRMAGVSLDNPTVLVNPQYAAPALTAAPVAPAQLPSQAMNAATRNVSPAEDANLAHLAPWINLLKNVPDMGVKPVVTNYSAISNPKKQFMLSDM